MTGKARTECMLNRPITLSDFLCIKKIFISFLFKMALWVLKVPRKMNLMGFFLKDRKDIKEE